MGIHHVSLMVNDVDAAMGFYRDLIGMEELERPPFEFDGAWLDAGGGLQVHLIAGTVPDDRGQHVALAVRDLDDVVAALRDAGLDVPDPKPVADRPIRQTFVLDPSGNRVEFTQPSSATRQSKLT